MPSGKRRSLFLLSVIILTIANEDILRVSIISDLFRFFRILTIYSSPLDIRYIERVRLHFLLQLCARSHNGSSITVCETPVTDFLPIW